MATTVGSISAGAFVKYHDQDTVFLKFGVAQQRTNIGFQPVICLRQGAIMCIVIQIGNDKREIRQLVVAEVSCELGERDQVELFCAAIYDIREIGEGIMMPDI